MVETPPWRYCAITQIRKTATLSTAARRGRRPISSKRTAAPWFRYGREFRSYACPDRFRTYVQCGKCSALDRTFWHRVEYVQSRPDRRRQMRWHGAARGFFDIGPSLPAEDWRTI